MVLRVNYFGTYVNDNENNYKPPILFKHIISPFICTPHNNIF